MSGTSATPPANPPPPPPYPPTQPDLTKLDEFEKKVEGLLEENFFSAERIPRGASSRIQAVHFVFGRLRFGERKGERKCLDGRREKVLIRAVQKCIGRLGCAERVPRRQYPLDTEKFLLEVEFKLRDRAEQTLTSLGGQSQVMMMYVAASALFLRNSVDSYARFTGLFLSSLSIAAFIVGVWLSTYIARQKLKNLVAPVQLLNKRISILHDSIDAFMHEFRGNKVFPSWIGLTHLGTQVPPDAIQMEIFFERRVRVIFEETMASNDYVRSYLGMVTLSTVAAATVAVGSFATSLYSYFTGGK